VTRTPTPSTPKRFFGYSLYSCCRTIQSRRSIRPRTIFLSSSATCIPHNYHSHIGQLLGVEAPNQGTAGTDRLGHNCSRKRSHTQAGPVPPSCMEVSFEGPVLGEISTTGSLGPSLGAVDQPCCVRIRYFCSRVRRLRLQRTASVCSTRLSYEFSPPTAESSSFLVS
jgi:hypothetical protein